MARRARTVTAVRAPCRLVEADRRSLVAAAAGCYTSREPRNVKANLMAWTIEISDTGDLLRISREPGARSIRTLRPEPRVTVERDARGPCAVEVIGDPVTAAVDAFLITLVAELAPEARMMVARHLRVMAPADPLAVEQA